MSPRTQYLSDTRAPRKYSNRQPGVGWKLVASAPIVLINDPAHYCECLLPIKQLVNKSHSYFVLKKLR